MDELLPAWAQEWYNGKVAAGLSPRTLENYRWTLDVLSIDLSQSSLAEIRKRLAEYSTHYNRGSLRLLTITVKQVLNMFDREKEAKALKLPKASEPRIVVYSQQEIDLMLKACQSLRDRLLIGILAETGARRGELYNMRIKDTAFDQYSGIIWLHGKTGTRQRRIYASQKDLLRYLRRHPNRMNAEAKFWITHTGIPLASFALYRIVTEVGWRALKRHVWPHSFRHHAATQDVRQFTDRETMLRHGWSTPAMVSVYAHLTGADVDLKDLKLHGIDPSIGSRKSNTIPQVMRNTNIRGHTSYLVGRISSRKCQVKQATLSNALSVDRKASKQTPSSP